MKLMRWADLLAAILLFAVSLFFSIQLFLQLAGDTSYIYRLAFIALACGFDLSRAVLWISGLLRRSPILIATALFLTLISLLATTGNILTIMNKSETASLALQSRIGVLESQITTIDQEIDSARERLSLLGPEFVTMSKRILDRMNDLSSKREDLASQLADLKSKLAEQSSRSSSIIFFTAILQGLGLPESAEPTLRLLVLLAIAFGTEGAALVSSAAGLKTRAEQAETTINDTADLEDFLRRLGTHPGDPFPTLMELRHAGADISPSTYYHALSDLLHRKAISPSKTRYILVTEV